MSTITENIETQVSPDSLSADPSFLCNDSNVSRVFSDALQFDLDGAELLKHVQGVLPRSRLDADKISAVASGGPKSTAEAEFGLVFAP